MIKVFLMILMPVFILGLRVSDAWMSDIERLKPATSNRIETFVFPTKSMTQDAMEYPRRIVDEKSFEPLYFKFRHKLNGKVHQSIPISAEEARENLHPQGIKNFRYIHKKKKTKKNNVLRSHAEAWTAEAESISTSYR